MIRRRGNRKGMSGAARRVARPFVFLVLVFGLIGGAELSAAIATEFLSAQEAELGRMLNQERSARGLPELAHSDGLRMIARRHAQRMMVEGTIFHSDRLRQDVEAVFPDWASIGENVGVGPSIPSVHRAFMDSPGHRANILDPDWGWMGLGVVSGGSRLFMTQNFLELRPGAPRPVPARLRLAGSTRTGTAQALADFGFAPGTAGGAVVADAFGFHGALAGASLAGQVNGPTLLTSTEEMSREALDGLRRALGQNPAGKRVFLVGGPFSSSVRSALEGLGATVVEVGGANQIAMAAAVARALPARPDAAIVATVADYPDALAGSALAAVRGWPVLYTDPAGLSPATQEVLSDLGIRRVFVVGGLAAVSPAVESALTGMGAQVTRLAGSTRFDTAVAIADFGLGQGLTAAHVQVATGGNFPDALAGGALSAVLRSPVLLTSTADLHPAAASWLRARRNDIKSIYLLGGEDAISSRVDQAIASTLR